MDEPAVTIIGPESHTDFTFVLIPERGFVPFVLGTCVVIAVTAWWVRRRRSRARR